MVVVSLAKAVHAKYTRSPSSSIWGKPVWRDVAKGAMVRASDFLPCRATFTALISACFAQVFHPTDQRSSFIGHQNIYPAHGLGIGYDNRGVKLGAPIFRKGDFYHGILPCRRKPGHDQSVSPCGRLGAVHRTALDLPAIVVYCSGCRPTPLTLRTIAMSRTSASERSL